MKKCFIAALFCSTLTLTGHAQFTADMQTITVSGVSNYWAIGTYYLGYSNSLDTLLIENGGVLTANQNSIIGNNVDANHNTAFITGGGSRWNSGSVLHVGSGGSDNQMIVTDGGAVSDISGFIGHDISSSNNSVLVTGTNSLWQTSDELDVGSAGGGNTLTIADGGRVSVYTFLYVGYFASSINNTVLVTGPGSVWTNHAGLTFGNMGAGNVLTITNGGEVLNDGGAVGYASSSNVVTVTGSGSVWSNGSSLYVGYSGGGNSLVITNGGAVYNNGVGGVGYYPGGSNNNALVTGNGSLWSSSSDLNVGFGSAGNRLTITNGGAVVNTAGTVGYGGFSSNNVVTVTGTGSIWNNTSGLYIGYYGSGNSLVITNGGAVAATSLVVGFSSALCDNAVTLAGGSLQVTNAAHTAVLEVRNGTFTQSAGSLVVDKLVVNNACARFIHTGGTLSIGTTILDPNFSAVGDGIPNGWKQQYGLDPFDPNLANEDPDGDGMSNLQEFLAGTDPTNSASVFRITAIAKEGNDVRVTWTTVGSHNYILQTNAPSPSGSFTNNFADFSPLIVVPGAGASTTNFVHSGATTNKPAQYYRVRLAP